MFQDCGVGEVSLRALPGWSRSGDYSDDALTGAPSLPTPAARDPHTENPGREPLLGALVTHSTAVTASLRLPQPVLGRKVLPHSSVTSRLLLFSSVSSQPPGHTVLQVVSSMEVSVPALSPPTCQLQILSFLKQGLPSFLGAQHIFRYLPRCFFLLLFITHRMVVCCPPPQIKILVKKKNMKYCGTKISLY